MTSSTLVLMVGAAPANLIQNGSFESALAGNWDLDCQYQPERGGDYPAHNVNQHRRRLFGSDQRDLRSF